MTENFWKQKTFAEFTDEEWEALCDKCGICCYRKIITGFLWWKKIRNTRIACDLLDTKSCCCKNYENRFSLQSDCLKLNRGNVEEFSWLPETCAYRLIFEGKELPHWHPLISGRNETVAEAGIPIKNGLNESAADGNWKEYFIE